MATYRNADGLRWRYPGGVDAVTKAGEYGDLDGSVHRIRIDIDADATSGLNHYYDTVVPQTAFVKRAYIFTESALVGGTITSVGLYNDDATAFDADGLDAAVVPVVGDEVEFDGALVGTRLTGDPHKGYHIGVTTDADITGGKANIFIEYFLGNA